MESTRTNAEIIKPVLLRAGLPLALSVAGFMCAKILAGKKILPKASLSQPHKVNSLETHSQSSSRHEDRDRDGDGDGFHSLASLVGEEMDSKTRIGYSEEDDYKCTLEEGYLGLKSRIEILQRREEELEKKFLHYLELKEQESALIELKNTLVLQIAYAEFLGREVSSMEAEGKRFEDLAVEFMKVVNQLENWKWENGLLQKKVKRLVRKTEAQARVIRQSNIVIEAKEAEILRTREELETRSNAIKNLEGEVKELRVVLDQLLKEKNDLQEKLDSSERTKEYAERNEDYKQLVNELELLQKERADEVKELIFLRWSNACLRHELMRNYEQQDQNLEKKHEERGEGEDHDHDLGLELNHPFDVSIMGHGENYLGVTTGSNHICSKRRRLIQKFRKWVEGSDKVKSRLDHSENHDVKCFGMHSVSDRAEEEHNQFLLHGRKSCSSA